MPYLEESYDIVVVGAGHAGCEAALACALRPLYLQSVWTVLPSCPVIPM